MILNLKTKKLDGKSLGTYESLTLALLSNNYCITKEEIKRFIYKDDNKILDNALRGTINRLRTKGIKIKSKAKFGYTLEDKIYIDY